MKLKILTLLLAFSTLISQAHAQRRAGDPYTYQPEFMQSQDSSCDAQNGALNDYYISHKIIASPDGRSVLGVALFVNYTVKMGIHDVICKTAATNVVFNKKLNSIDIIAIDLANALNWNKYRQDGNYYENETIARGKKSYLPIEALPMYQTLRIRILQGGKVIEPMLYNDSRNFMLYVYEDVFQWRTKKGGPIESAVLKNFLTYPRGTDEESLAEKIYYPKTDGSRIEVKY